MKNIKIDDLPSVKFTDLKNLPKISAVYFAVSMAGEVLYVGRTNNLKERWIAHHRHLHLKRLWCEKIAWIACDVSDLDTKETSMIELLKPMLNGAISPLSRKEGMKTLLIHLPQDLIRRFDAMNIFDGISRTERLIYLIEKDIKARYAQTNEEGRYNAEVLPA